MLHALRLEKLFPSLAGNSFGLNGMAEDFGERRGNLVWSHARVGLLLSTTCTMMGVDTDYDT